MRIIIVFFGFFFCFQCLRVNCMRRVCFENILQELFSRKLGSVQSILCLFAEVKFPPLFLSLLFLLFLSLLLIFIPSDHFSPRFNRACPPFQSSHDGSRLPAVQLPADPNPRTLPVHHHVRHLRALRGRWQVGRLRVWILCDHLHHLLSEVYY